VEDHKCFIFLIQAGNHIQYFLNKQTVTDGGKTHATDLEVKMIVLLYLVNLMQEQLSPSLPVSNFSTELKQHQLIGQMLLSKDLPILCLTILSLLEHPLSY
jgi:hypothetical protein